MSEIWKPVPGWPGYEVSDLGRVRSIDRLVRCRNGIVQRQKGRLRVAHPNPRGGYPKIRLAADGRTGPPIFVHRLVLEAFVGPRPAGTVTRHLNGVKDDNRLCNLVYGTHSENNLDKVRHGTDHNAVKTHCPHGHEYTTENTFIRARGGRECRTCIRRRSLRDGAARRLLRDMESAS